MLKIKCIREYDNVRKPSLKRVMLEREKVVKRAMGCYRRYYYELKFSMDMLYKEYGLPKEISCDKLIDWKPADNALQSRVELIRNTYIFLKTLKEATYALVNYSERGQDIHYIMKASYLNWKGMTTERIAKQLGLSERTCYRLKKIGFKLLCKTLWDAPILLNDERNETVSFYELFMEVYYGKKFRY